MSSHGSASGHRRRAGRARALTCLATALGLLGLPSSAAVAVAATVGTPAPGTITTYAGGVGRGSATMVSQSPSAIAVDGRHLYVADTRWSVVRVVDTATGDEQVVAGTGEMGDTGDGGPATAARVQSPAGIAFDAGGRLYVADLWGNRIRRVDRSGIISTVAANGTRAYSGDGGPAAAAGFDGPYALAFDSQGRLYVGDSSARVRRIGADGTITTVVGTGTVGVSGDDGPATAAQIGVGVALAFDPAGNLYVGDAVGRVRKVTPSGIITTVAGGGSQSGDRSDGTPAVTARLGRVNALQVDGDGTILISEEDGRVRGVPASGLLTTVAGHTSLAPPLASRPALDAQLFGTSAMATDPDGNLYLGAGSLIRKVDTSGILSWVYGDPANGGENIVDPPRNLLGVNGLAVDVDGTIVVADDFRILLGLERLWPARHRHDGDGRGSPASRRPHRRAGSGGRGVPFARLADRRHRVGVGVERRGRARRRDHGRAPHAGAGARPRPREGDRRRRLPLPRPTGRTAPLWPGDTTPLGQLGDGTTVDRHAPVAVVGLTGASSLAAAAFHSLSVQGDGTVRAWGWNGYGQLGTGTAGDSRVPMAVAGLTDVRQLAAGAYYHSAALRTDGSVWTWGWNAYDQLGDPARGGVGMRAVKVPGLGGVTSIAAGAYDTLATKGDGTVRAWGWNALGQLGDGTTVDRHVPVRSGLSADSATAGGLAHTLGAAG